MSESMYNTMLPFALSHTITMSPSLLYHIQCYHLLCYILVLVAFVNDILLVHPHGQPSSSGWDFEHSLWWSDLEYHTPALPVTQPTSHEKFVASIRVCSVIPEQSSSTMWCHTRCTKDCTILTSRELLHELEWRKPVHKTVQQTNLLCVRRWTCSLPHIQNSRSLFNHLMLFPFVPIDL